MIGQEVFELEHAGGGEPAAHREGRPARSGSASAAGGDRGRPGAVLGRGTFGLDARSVVATPSSTARTVNPSATIRLASSSWKLRSGVPSKCPGVSGRNGAVGQGPLDAGRQLEEAEGVGDRRPALADPRRHLLVGVAELVDELLEGAGLLRAG